MPDKFFFGYGSLVNRGTHDYPQAQKARANGWRRAWRATPLRALSYLTVVPSEGDFVEGLIAAVPGADWAALDVREQAYRRKDAAHQIKHQAGRDLEVVIYAIEAGKHSDPTDENPILLSYIDVVVQGYLHEFGPDGAQHFFETTGGWHAPILNDRAAPVYPRHQVLSVEEREIVDAGIALVGGQIP